MPNPTTPTEPPFPTRFRRAAALVSICARSVRRGWLSRIGRVYGWGTAFGGGVLLTWALARGETAAPGYVLPAVLGWASWPAGLVACAAARDLEADDRGTGVEALAGLRGFDAEDLGRARVVARMTTVARAVGLPVLTLGTYAAARSPSLRHAATFAPWLLGVLSYALVFGAVLGALSTWSARLSARHGRLVFLAFAFAPYAAREIMGSVPSLVSAFAWLAHRVALLGVFSA